MASPRARGFWDAFGDAVGEGREDWSRQFRANRASQGKDENAPRWNEMMGSHPTMSRLGELIYTERKKRNADLSNKNAEDQIANRTNLGIGPEKEGNGRRAGQLLGTAANDLVNDTTRGIYWLLNAVQATGNVIGESTLGSKRFGNPALYGRHDVLTADKRPATIEKDFDYLRDKGYVRGNIDDYTVKPGVTTKTKHKTNNATGEITSATTLNSRNYQPGHVASLLIPAGVAINSGIGLMTPFGGAEGYKAVEPSEEDPTKTNNVIMEIAQKYIMGKTGKLLPYDEFVKVRPDVSREEYAAYQAEKYDNNEDYNPLDGDISVLGGALKATDTGIHGPEISILGRPLPVTTGVVPFLGALGGAAAGVRSKKPIRHGMIGGTAGLAVGQILGNAIEGERRRRNMEDNMRDDSQGLV